MISDEQRNAFEKWATSQQFCLGRFNSVDEYMNDNTHFAWEGWQAAQKVKELDFVLDHDNDLVAHTMSGCFIIMIREGWYIFNGTPYGTEAEAIEAANVDYKRRALSCLVNGGV